jgi:beta-barrel assembly-enhancing protease
MAVPAAIRVKSARAPRKGMRWLVLASAIVITACASQRPPSRPPVAPLPRATAPQAEAPPVAPVESGQPPVPVTPGQPAAPYGAPDKASVLRTWVELQNRLYRVAAPLLLNNTELCSRHARNLLGLTAKTRYSYTSDFAAEAQSALGLEDRLRVMSVLPGSGAAQAGVMKGDILLVVEIEPLPEGPSAEREGASLIGSEMQGRTNLSLTVLRNDERVVLDIPLTRACAMAIDVGNADFVNSYADGQRAAITRGMINFTRSDEELAYVVAKEIAHNVLAQAPRPDISAVIDRLRTFSPSTAGSEIGATLPPYSADQDANADRLALYLLTRAGYGIDHVAAFWKRLAESYPASVRDSHTALHPATEQRLAAIADTVHAIQTKQNGHLPLLP